VGSRARDDAAALGSGKGSGHQAYIVGADTGDGSRVFGCKGRNVLSQGFDSLGVLRDKRFVVQFFSNDDVEEAGD